MARQVYSYDPPERFVAGTVGQPGQRTFFLQARGDGRLTTVALEKEQVLVLAQRLDELLDEVLRRSRGQAPVPAVAPDELEDLAPLDPPIEEEFRVGTLTLAWDADAEMVVIEAFAAADSGDPEGPEDPEDPEDPQDPEVMADPEGTTEAAAERAAAEVLAAELSEQLDPELAGQLEEELAERLEEELAARELAAATGDRDVLVVRMTGAAARAFVRRARALVAAGRPPCPLCAQPLDPQGHVCPRQNGYRRRG